MSEQASAQGGSGGETGSVPEETDEAREAALMRKVMRMQERHREGGVDPGLEDDDAEPGPGA